MCDVLDGSPPGRSSSPAPHSPKLSACLTVTSPWVRLRRRLVGPSVEMVLFRRLRQSRARLAALDRLATGGSEDVSYRNQGDADMYSCAAMQKRAFLKTHPNVSFAVRAIWRHATCHLAPGQKIVRKYVTAV